MSETPTETMGINPKPPETELDSPESDFLQKIEASLREANTQELEKLASQNPREPFCWAALSIDSLSGDSKISSYAFARIGYHRGLDLLRANGWRGSGYVRTKVEGNRGFLCSLALLKQLAKSIGEDDEVARCGEFLMQLDPSYDWNTFESSNPIDFIFTK
ncbi:MAG TPA: DUF3151 domain-containing protein [Acidimicrobiia bacterium]|nr:DUF3151 domain-containing protein [Acidimicrobiia bacterium]